MNPPILYSPWEELPPPERFVCRVEELVQQNGGVLERDNILDELQNLLASYVVETQLSQGIVEMRVNPSTGAPTIVEVGSPDYATWHVWEAVDAETHPDEVPDMAVEVPGLEGAEPRGSALSALLSVF